MQKVLLGSLLLALCSVGSAIAAPGVEVRLGAAQDRADFGSGKVQYAISNRSNAPIHVLKWQTPLEGVTANLFVVERNGKRVDYVGAYYKRSAPTAADYVELGVGESKSVEVDLSAYYDMRERGQYSVRYAREAADVVREAQIASKAGVQASLGLSSEATTLWLDGGPDALGEATDKSFQTTDSSIGVAAASNSYVSCSNARKTSLASARTSAASYASNSKSYLDTGNTGSRYTWWFGTYQSTRYSTVRTHYANLVSALSSAAYTFHCDCSDAGTYAYVYPTQPYHVHLCGAFWSAPATGTDSKAGTLVHESSHFNVVASTDDWAYGQTAAHNLAGSNPAHAIDNADSHEYFAENNPARN